MEISNDNKTRNARRESDQSDKIVVLPRRQNHCLFPEFPEKMVVTLDGWAEIEKAELARDLAYKLDGAIVDADRFYRSLIAACLDCGVDVSDYASVATFAKRIEFRTKFAQEVSPVLEAQVAVNDRWFSAVELTDSADAPSRMAMIPEVRDKVNEALRACEYRGRLIVVGRDAGITAFPKSPYKFFLDFTEGVRHLPELDLPLYPGAGVPSQYSRHPFVTVAWNGFNVLMVNTTAISPNDLGPIILGECVLRAMEWNEYTPKARRTPGKGSQLHFSKEDK